uniref:Uncharacterized protein n=1 Tax=Arundo donax TaxID=35708 RepID=A0A0A9GRP3_ARUDO
MMKPDFLFFPTSGTEIEHRLLHEYGEHKSNYPRHSC